MSSSVIASLQNPRVKAAVALRDRRDRIQTGLTIVDGGRECLRAIEAGVDVVEAFVCSPLLRPGDAMTARGLLTSMDAHRARVAEVTEPVLERVAFGDRVDGIVLVIRTPSTALASLEVGDGPLVAVVESVEKPGNLGAILRSADGAGLDAVIAADPLTDVFNPNAIRASLGTIFTVPTAEAPTPEMIDWLRKRRIRPVVALVDAPRLYTEADLTGAVAIVLGSEASGLSAAWREADALAVRLPMHGAGDSLNVSAAAAVLFYEARRQRDARPERRIGRT